MSDVHTPEQRSRNMAAIRSKHTKPEMEVRRLLLEEGFRYRRHGKKLPGKPDFVFAGRRKVIFVHGCFWHRHTCRWGSVAPKTNAEFWEAKIGGNQSRDRRHLAALRKEGWKTLVVWECQLRKPEVLRRRMVRFLAVEG